jgi:hypothetical protein
VIFQPSQSEQDTPIVPTQRVPMSCRLFQESVRCYRRWAVDPRGIFASVRSEELTADEKVSRTGCGDDGP